jgi:hypothetical protein
MRTAKAPRDMPFISVRLGTPHFPMNSCRTFSRLSTVRGKS